MYKVEPSGETLGCSIHGMDLGKPFGKPELGFVLQALAARAEDVKRLVAAGKPTIPATIGAEKLANPFLRADVDEVAKSVGLSGSPAWKVFAEMRERKNRF